MGEIINYAISEHVEDGTALSCSMLNHLAKISGCAGCWHAQRGRHPAAPFPTPSSGNQSARDANCSAAVAWHEDLPYKLRPGKYGNILREAAIFPGRLLVSDP